MHNEIMADRGSDHYAALNNLLDLLHPDSMLAELRLRMRQTEAEELLDTAPDIRMALLKKLRLFLGVSEQDLPDDAPEVDVRIRPLAPRIYIAGPMRLYKDRQYNFPAFDAARDHLKALGWSVVSPADMDRNLGFDGHDEASPEFMREAIVRDTRAICQDCQAIYMMREWEKSGLAPAEKAMAESIGLDVYYQAGAWREESSGEEQAGQACDRSR